MKTNIALRQIIQKLDHRELFILKNYYAADTDKRTLTQIALTLNISHERVRQIKNLALKKIHKTLLKYGVRSEEDLKFFLKLGSL